MQNMPFLYIIYILDINPVDYSLFININKYIRHKKKTPQINISNPLFGMTLVKKDLPD